MLCYVSWTIKKIFLKLTYKPNCYFKRFPKYCFATDRLLPECQSCNSFKI